MDFLFQHARYEKAINLAPYHYVYFRDGEEHGYIALPKTRAYPLFFAFYRNRVAGAPPPWFSHLVSDATRWIDERDRIRRLLT